MAEQVAVGVAVAFLYVLGVAVALFSRDGVQWRWLTAAAGMLVLNDVLLTQAYGLLPSLWPAARHNWDGKLLALAGTLLMAAARPVGWTASGLTVKHQAGSLRSALTVTAASAALYLVAAWVFPNPQPLVETVAFQLTLPGLEEEPFYRGILLLALTRAFPQRLALLGVEWSWGAVASCVVFGLAHAVAFQNGRVQFDVLAMALTAIPSLLAVWLVLRTRSLVLPIVLHNFGNTVLTVL